ncbi:MAG: TrkH family potassium uptake protein [Clostridiales bacterium]|nr:TrkH family potassium uptake protein [Clostridiales bacterium]
MRVITKIKGILKIQSSLFIILAFILLLPISISIIHNESSMMYQTYLISSGISFIIGLTLRLMTRDTHIKITLTTSMIICAMAWLSISLIGSIPFMIGLEKGFIDSFFESVSGFTTTGITVFQGLDTMPLSIIFWRALIQWVGGLGILTFFLFVTFSGEGDIWQLFSAEGHKINSSRPVPNVFETVKILWFIYATLTIIEFILLKFLGLSLFDALTHSMTSLSTGGFSGYDASIGYFSENGYENYKAIEYVITLFMLFGGMNFLIHYKVIFDTPKYLIEDLETKNYFKIILGFTSLMIISMFMIQSNIFSNFEEIFRKTIFQVVSVITTTGFGTQDIGSNFFPALSKQLFLILMVIGGSVGSTSGGVKVIRITILSKLFRREIRKIRLPNKAVLPVVLSGSKISEDEVYRVSGLFFGWLLIVFIGSGITALFSDLDAFQSISGMASAMGNIGPFYFSVEKMASLSPIIKLTYAFGMLAGRLEILPLLVLVSKKAWME